MSAFFVLSALAAGPDVYAQPVPPWDGAWEWLHETDAGRLIILDSWFCGVFGAKDRAAPPGILSEAARASLFRTMSGAMCGRTSVEFTPDGGAVLVTEAEFTARPQSAGRVARRPTRVEGDRMAGDLLRSDGSLLVTWWYRRLSPPGTGALAGVWRLDSPDWDGLLVMTDSEYRFVVHRRDRSGLATGGPADLTDAEAAALYDAYDAEGGSYRHTALALVRTPAVARDPRLQGVRLETSLDLQGDSLSLEIGEQLLEWVRVR